MSNSLVIEELTGTKRRLELRGAGMPFRPTGWGSETVVSTKWFPGNREGNQHVLSPRIIPAEWEGVWRTTQLLRTPALWAAAEGATGQEVAFAHELQAIFESLQMEGQVLRVTWATQSPASSLQVANPIPRRELRIVRVGRLTSVNFRYETVDDLGWGATFEWSGRGDGKGVFVTPSRDLVAAIRSAIVSQEGVRAVVLTGLEAPPTRFSLGQLEAVVDAPRAIVDSFARAAIAVTSRLKDLGDLVLKVRDTPAALVGRALDVANNAVATSNNFLDQISREGPETWTASTKLSMLTKTASFYGEAQTQAELMADANVGLAEVARRRRSALVGSGDRVGAGDVMQVHLPREGETWSTIAIKFYGEDLGGEVARANGFPEYQVIPPRTPIIIPARSAIVGDR